VNGLTVIGANVSRYLLIASLAAATIALAACSDDGDGDSTPTVAPPTSVSSSPTAAPATPSPAPARPVEAGAYTAERVLPQLDFTRMIEIAAIPGDDDHAVVITQAGEVYRFSLTDDNEEPSPYLDVTGKLISNPGNEEGLLGIAFDPDFEQSRRFYIYYSAGPPRRTVLERYLAPAGAADPASAQVLLEIEDPYSNHNGGGLEFGPDGYLYLAVGDGGSGGDPHGNGQNTNTLLGKIHRLDVSGDAYTSPPDNPFANGGGRPEIFAYGFRNPWRITFDSETGDLWTGDVGQGTREEVDLVTIGGNYGWSIMEGDLCFQSSEGCDTTGLILPRAAYENGRGDCAVSGGYVYRGTEMPELVGWYVYADYCSGKVWALDTEDPAAQPVLIAETGLSVPGFWQDAAGEIYLVTFNESVAKLVRR
jgi:glucose/arabinose dehydrogenase